jgi:hypothetical protein
MSMITALAGLFFNAILASPTSQVSGSSGKDAITILRHLDKQALQNLKEAGDHGGCTLENATKRKDW